MSATTGLTLAALWIRAPAWALEWTHASIIPEIPMPPRIARLAGLGAFAACGGIALLYALFLLITRPAPTSGMDGTQRFIAWLSVAGVLLALLAVHLLVGRQLLAMARGDAERV